MKILYFLLIFVSFIFLSCTQKTDTDTQHSQADTAPSIAILITEGFHDTETLRPIEFFRNAGYSVVIIGDEVKSVTAYNSNDIIEIEKSVTEVNPEDFVALIIPGGRSPAHLRNNPEVLEFVKNVYLSGTTLAAICHGPQVMASAGILNDKEVTATRSIEQELLTFGAVFINQEVVIDGNIITSRFPSDIPFFLEAIKNSIE